MGSYPHPQTSQSQSAGQASRCPQPAGTAPRRDRGSRNQAPSAEALALEPDGSQYSGAGTKAGEERPGWVRPRAGPASPAFSSEKNWV